MNSSAYTRPNKPKYIEVRRRDAAVAPPPLVVAEPISVDSATQCHVTPAEVAARMADYLGLPEDTTALDPQGGTGNLVAALVDAGYTSIITVERHHALRQVIENRFSDSVAQVLAFQDCFLEYARYNPRKHRRIITNPPFKGIKAHMDAALSLLEEDDAAMVALVPVTYHHDEAELLETLAPDTFPHLRVNTKLIIFER